MFLVVHQELPSIRNAQRYLAFLMRMGFNQDQKATRLTGILSVTQRVQALGGLSRGREHYMAHVETCKRLLEAGVAQVFARGLGFAPAAQPVSVQQLGLRELHFLAGEQLLDRRVRR